MDMVAADFKDVEEKFIKDFALLTGIEILVSSLTTPQMLMR